MKLLYPVPIWKIRKYPQVRFLLRAGGPGSGCHGENCGRPPGPGTVQAPKFKQSSQMLEHHGWTKTGKQKLGGDKKATLTTYSHPKHGTLEVYHEDGGKTTFTSHHPSGVYRQNIGKFSQALNEHLTKLSQLGPGASKPPAPVESPESSPQQESPKPPLPPMPETAHTPFQDVGDSVSWEIHNAGLALNKGWTQTLTLDEIQAVEHYTATGYQTLNIQLRQNAQMSADTLRNVQNLDNALGKAVLKEPVITYRGFGSKSDLIGNLQPGQAIVDNGFISSSLKKSPAMAFTPAPGRPIARIELPAGLHAAYVSSHSYHSGEYEVLIARGTMFQFVSKHYEGANPVITVRAIQSHMIRSAAEKRDKPSKVPTRKSGKYEWNDSDVKIINLPQKQKK